MPPVIDSLKANVGQRLHARQIRFAPLLPAGLRIASAVVNRLTHAGAIPVSGVVQRPVAEQLHLNFTAAGLRDGVAFLDGRERRGADDSHPVGASAKSLLRQGFTGIGHFPVGDDDFFPGTALAGLSPR